MQSSLHGRTLLEAAVVRVCNLEKLETISELISQLSDPKASKPSGRAVPRQRVEMRRVDVAGTADQAALKKNGIAPSQEPQQSANVAVETEAQVASVTTSQPGDAKEGQGSSEVVAVDVPVKPAATVVSASAGESPATGDFQPAGEAIPLSDSRSTPLDSRSIEAHWKTVLETMGDMTAEMAANYESVELKGADQLLVTLRDKVSRDLCMKPERRVRFEEAFAKETRQAVRVEFLVSQKTIERPAPKPKLTRAQQVRKLQDVALVKEAMELFDAEITGFREPIPSKKR
jgi:DNA polymerase-3 subunit gamma/tau